MTSDTKNRVASRQRQLGDDGGDDRHPDTILTASDLCWTPEPATWPSPRAVPTHSRSGRRCADHHLRADRGRTGPQLPIVASRPRPAVLYM